jgi:hypothetical protein
LPGTLWPAGCDRGQGDPLFFAPVTKQQANELLVAFDHPLDPFTRPFGFQGWGLAIDGQAVAVAVSGSTVGSRAAGFARREVVDLAGSRVTRIIAASLRVRKDEYVLIGERHSSAQLQPKPARCNSCRARTMTSAAALEPVLLGVTCQSALNRPNRLHGQRSELSVVHVPVQ